MATETTIECPVPDADDQDALLVLHSTIGALERHLGARGVG